MTEIWKDIEGYEGNYQVSNLGRVRSVDRVVYLKSVKQYRRYKGKIMKSHPSKGGYLHIPVGRYKGIKIHRAVAIAFVPGYFDGAEVNHKDENRQNNRADNLEWVTHQENISYGSHNRKTQKYLEETRGIPVAQHSTNGDLIATYPSISSAARATGAYSQNISRSIKTGGTTVGFIFKLI